LLNVIFLIVIILGLSGQNVVKKPYTKIVGEGGVYFFSTLLSAAALIFFVVISTELKFDTSYIPYSIGFAVAYAMATVFMTMAIANGSLSLTSLFISYSLMIPTFYGIIFLKDDISIGFILGVFLLIISLFLVNKGDEKARFSFKWIICVVLSFVGNGMCTVIQKMQQVASRGAYKNEFMIVALAIVTVVMLVMSLIKERKELKVYAIAGWHWALICGLLNGMVNLFVMILSGRMAVSLMFPLISAGGLVVTYIISRFFYKEKLTKVQFVGFVFGLSAVVFLNI
jgi:drug/metabolite transporter (DMT)-like permease